MGACPAHIRKSLGGLGRHCSPYPSDPSAHRIFRQILWSSLKGVQTQGQCKPEPAAGWHTHADRPAAASSKEAGATGWQVLRQPHPQRTGRQAGAVGMRPCFRHSPGQQGASGRGTGQAWAMQHSAGTPAGPTLICFLGAVVLGTERLGHGLVQKQRTLCGSSPSHTSTQASRPPHTCATSCLHRPRPAGTLFRTTSSGGTLERVCHEDTTRGFTNSRN